MQLIDIAYRPQVKAPMQTTAETMITRIMGVSGDARGKPGKRQITVLSVEQWQQACAELNMELPWTIRRANLLVQGMVFGPESVGKQIKIGQVILLVTGETDPCHKIDAQQAGLRQALTPHWRGGVCCTVLADGRVCRGDAVQVY